MNLCARFTLVGSVVLTFACSSTNGTGSSVRPEGGSTSTGGSSTGGGSGGTGNITSNGGLGVVVGGGPGDNTGGMEGKSCDGKLTGYIRDFLAKDSPDFEPFDMTFPNRMPGKMDTNVVEADIIGTTLDDKLKPIYLKGDGVGSLTTTGKTNFDTWFRDVEGVNKGQELTLQFTLDPNDPTGKTYVFDSGTMGFFPIDGMLLGPTTTPPDEGRPHNFSFTFELHTKFKYAPGQVFHFRGDDDVWAFINNQRVIDIGGIHDAFERDVQLDTLGLTAGQTYPLDFFFAERHVGASNFLCSTSIEFTECDIIVVK